MSGRIERDGARGRLAGAGKIGQLRRGVLVERRDFLFGRHSNTVSGSVAFTATRGYSPRTVRSPPSRNAAPSFERRTRNVATASAPTWPEHVAGPKARSWSSRTTSGPGREAGTAGPLVTSASRARPTGNTAPMAAGCSWGQCLQLRAASGDLARWATPGTSAMQRCETSDWEDTTREY